MESEHYICGYKEAYILVCIVYHAINKKYYSSVPQVMLSSSNLTLLKETGLSYIECDNTKFYFHVLDKHKFLLTKIKYGI